LIHGIGHSRRLNVDKMYRFDKQGRLIWNQPYKVTAAPTGWRKRQVIDKLLADLHGQHEDMIERALAMSGTGQAEEILKKYML
jgi:hypothetical protein